MRILSIIHYPVFGGPHNRSLRLAPILRKKGIHTTLVLPEESGDSIARFDGGELDVVLIPLGRVRATWNPLITSTFVVRFLPDVKRLRKLVRQNSIDLVLINGLVNPQAAIAAWMEEVPLVWQIIDTRTPMILRKILMPMVNRLADVVMCTGMEVARAHPGTMELKERLIPFFSPVDTQEFRPDHQRRKQARVELGVPENGILIGTVGNLNPQKGHEYLVQAGSIILRHIPELYIRILGSTYSTHQGYKADLQENANTLGLTKNNRFRFVDPGSRVAELLPAFDVFLLTSVPRSEGVPTVILEAMACGLPVVTTDVGGVREVVMEGVTGYVVPPLDPEAISKAVLHLLNDAELRRIMGERAREHAVEKYDATICADTHMRAFEIARTYHEKKRMKGALLTNLLV